MLGGLAFERQVTMRVFLDSNVLISDFYFNSVNTKQFIANYSKVPAKLYLPKIVVDEVVNKYKEKLKEHEREYLKAIGDINKMLQTPYRQVPIKVDEISGEYEKWLLSFIKENDIEILPYPRADIEAIVKHDLSRKKPFKPDGSGYRDYLIFLTILEHFDVYRDSVVFITANKADFFQDGKIHPDLFKINSRQFTNDIEAIYSIKEFNEKYLISYIQPQKEKVNVIYKGNEVDIEDYLRGEIEDILRNNDSFDGIFEFSHSGAHLSHIDRIAEINYIVAYKGQSGFRIVVADIKISGIVSIMLSKEDIENDKKTYDYYGEYLESGSVDLDTKDDIKVKLIIRIDYKKIEDVEIMALESSFGSYEIS